MITQEATNMEQPNRSKQQQAKPVAEQWRVKAVAIDEPDVGEDGTIYEYQIINSHGADIARCDDETEADRIVAAINAGAVNAELLAALKRALPYIERVADTTPTEINRQQRQRQACTDVATARATIAKAEQDR